MVYQKDRIGLKLGQRVDSLAHLMIGRLTTVFCLHMIDYLLKSLLLIS